MPSTSSITVNIPPEAQRCFVHSVSIAGQEIIFPQAIPAENLTIRMEPAAPGIVVFGDNGTNVACVDVLQADTPVITEAR